MAVFALMIAAPAAAVLSQDERQAPVLGCSELTSDGVMAAFIAVPADPTAYQKCGPAGPLGIKHCQSGADFDAAAGYCVVKDGHTRSDATLSVDAVWQEEDACNADCPPRPIKIRLNYSGRNVGMVSVTLSDPTMPADRWGGSATALTGDGDTHSVVVTANKMVPTAGDRVLKPGVVVAVQAYLTDGRANPDGDPTPAVATLSTTVTASGRAPSAS